MRRANYDILLMFPEFILIEDVGPWDQHPTVTNAAEIVVTELTAKKVLAPGTFLFYKDSEGDIDELKHDGRGNFIGFGPGHAFHGMYAKVRAGENKYGE